MLIAVGGSRQVHQSEAGLKEKTPEAGAVIEQLERILASGDFDASPRSRAFVRFIVEETLARPPGAAHPDRDRNPRLRAPRGLRPDGGPDRPDPGRAAAPLARALLPDVGSRGPGPHRAAARDVRARRALGRRDAAAPARRRREPRGSARRRLALRRGAPVRDRRLARSSSAASSLLDEQLCVEMGRYGDVRVVRRRELDQLGSSRRPRRLRALGRVSCERRRPRGSRRACWTAATRARSGPRSTAAPLDATSAFYEETARAIAARVASEQGVVAKQLWGEQRTGRSPSSRPTARSCAPTSSSSTATPPTSRPRVEALRARRARAAGVRARLGRSSPASTSRTTRSRSRRPSPDRRGVA